MSTFLKRRKEKCHSSVFRKAFQISRKKFSCHIHLKAFGFNEVFDSCRDGKIWCRLNKLRYPWVLIIITFPKRVGSQELHLSSFVCNTFSIWWQLSSSFPLSSYKKWMPSILMGVCIHFLPRGLLVLFAHFPSQMAYVFSLIKQNIYLPVQRASFEELVKLSI